MQTAIIGKKKHKRKINSRLCLFVWLETLNFVRKLQQIPLFQALFSGKKND